MGDLTEKLITLKSETGSGSVYNGARTCNNGKYDEIWKKNSTIETTGAYVSEKRLKALKNVYDSYSSFPDRSSKEFKRKLVKLLKIGIAEHFEGSKGYFLKLLRGYKGRYDLTHRLVNARIESVDDNGSDTKINLGEVDFEAMDTLDAEEVARDEELQFANPELKRHIPGSG